VDRVFFGSNTINAMRQLTCPLIVVPPDAKFTNIKKIGLACDLVKVADTLPREEIKLLVNEFNAELHILHVNTENETHFSPVTITESGSLQRMLQDLNPQYHFLNNTDVEEGLSQFAEANKLDLLIVVPRKHSIIESLFRKSHSKKMILHTHVPVMAIHE
jgi:nucleotide-binding universal stress UspA family protein